MSPPDSRGPPPKFKPFIPNRVDAHPQLLAYHDTSTGPKPKPTKTELLPLRTFIPSNYNPLTDLFAAQTHAYYEEIDSIFAAAVGERSPFEGTEHWYIVHPLSPTEVRGQSTLVLDELRRWIEGSLDVYVGKAKQVNDFRQARKETFDLVVKELARRNVGEEVDDKEGYLGKWEDIEDDLGGEEKGRVGEEMPKMQRRRTSGNVTDAGLAAADDMAMKMIAELRKSES